MNSYQGPGAPRRVGPSAESTLLTLAIIALAIVLLSAVTLVPRGASNNAVNAGGATPGLDGSSGGAGTDGSFAVGDSTGGIDAGATPGVGDTGGGFASTGGSSTGGVTSGGTSFAGGTSSAGTPTGSGGSTSGGATPAGSSRGGTTAGGATSGGTTSGSGGSTSGGSAACDAAHNGGSTDTGVTASSIKIGASTVNSGPGATFLQPEDTAMKAVAAQVNSKGGVCGRKIELILHDSEWKAPKGASLIENMVQAEKVFALAVNPDSEGLNAVSVAPYGNGKLDTWKVPVIGTDGLLFSQYVDPYIWPIAASTSSAMHAMASSQFKNGAKKFSIVYEETYRFGREGAKAYNNQVKALTGKNIPGYSDPDTNPKCQGSFCGIQSSSGQASYGSEANTFAAACCDAGAVLLEPATAIQWFKSGGRFGGVPVGDAAGGKGAAPQPLFQRYFADGCQKTCNAMRLWTGFLPPIGDFANRPAVAQYVNTMKAYSSTVDVNNQFAEGAYVGMQLTLQVLKSASTAPGGLTRANVISVLNNTKGWDNGLTVSPLSWSASNHFAETSVHAFDELYPSGFGGWQYVQGSVTPDPSPGKI